MAEALDIDAELTALQHDEIDAIGVERAVVLVLLFGGEAQHVAIERDRLLQVIHRHRDARNPCRHSTTPQWAPSAPPFKVEEILPRRKGHVQCPTMTSPTPSTRRVIWPSTRRTRTSPVPTMAASRRSATPLWTTSPTPVTTTLSVVARPSRMVTSPAPCTAHLVGAAAGAAGTS